MWIDDLDLRLRCGPGGSVQGYRNELLRPGREECIMHLYRSVGREILPDAEKVAVHRA